MPLTNKDIFDIDMQKMGPFFSQGSQAVSDAIAGAFSKHQLPDCDMYDLFYFHCLFLRTLISRFLSNEHGNTLLGKSSYEDGLCSH